MRRVASGAGVLRPSWSRGGVDALEHSCVLRFGQTSGAGRDEDEAGVRRFQQERYEGFRREICAGDVNVPNPILYLAVRHRARFKLGVEVRTGVVDQGVQAAEAACDLLGGVLDRGV